MKGLDVLRPYADLAKLLAWAALAGGLFVTGCQHGEGTQVAKNQKAIAKAEQAHAAAEATAAENLRAANACGQLLSDISDATDAAAARAQEQRELAEQAARRATQQAEESRRRATAAERELQESKNQPACRQQLELKLCDAIPLL